MQRGSRRVERDFTVQAIAAQVHQTPSVSLDPILHPLHHLTRPVLGVYGKDKHSIGIKRQRAIVQLSFGVIVISEPFTFQPAEQAPLARCLAALNASLYGILDRKSTRLNS